MPIQNQMLFLPVPVSIHLPFPVKNGVCVMNDTVMIGADDNLVAGIIVKAIYEVIYMMRFRNMRTEFLSDYLST